MRPTVAAVVLAALSAAGAIQLGAQASPTEVAAAFFKAVTEERWRDAARELDLAAFDRFRRERIAAERLSPPRQSVVTADDLLRRDPDMPRAVAEYQVKKIEEATRETASWTERDFANVSGIDSLAALSAEEAAARWLQARDLRWTTRRLAERERARGCVLPPEAGQRTPAPARQIVGTVIADSTTAYVLHLETVFRRAEPDVDAAMYADPPYVMTLRRRSGRWRILPREGMLHGMVGIAFTAIDCRPGARPPR